MSVSNWRKNFRVIFGRTASMKVNEAVAFARGYLASITAAYRASSSITKFIMAHIMLASSSSSTMALPGCFGSHASVRSMIAMRTRRLPWRLPSLILSAINPQYRFQTSKLGGMQRRILSVWVLLSLWNLSRKA
jgi:hypothetical protein